MLCIGKWRVGGRLRGDDQNLGTRHAFLTVRLSGMSASKTEGARLRSRRT